MQVKIFSDNIPEEYRESLELSIMCLFNTIRLIQSSNPRQACKTLTNVLNGINDELIGKVSGNEQTD